MPAWLPPVYKCDVGWRDLGWLKSVHMPGCLGPIANLRCHGTHSIIKTHRFPQCPSLTLTACVQGWTWCLTPWVGPC